MKRNLFIISVLAAVIAVSTLLPPLKTYGAYNGYPTLFVNDDYWVSEKFYGWEYIDGVIYLPSYAFAPISNMKIITSAEYPSTAIVYGSKYISIDTKSMEWAINDQSQTFPFRTYYLKSGTAFNMLYVPAQTVCDYFGLTLQTAADGKAVRICDGSETLTFESLLEIYNPALLTPESSETAPPGTVSPPDDTTSPETTAPPETTEKIVISAEKVYLVFDGIESEFTPQIIEILDKYGIGAVFLVNADDITKNQSLIRDIIISGAGVGIALSGESGTVQEAAEVNELLYRAYSLNTRLCALTGEKYNADEIKRLETDYGYICLYSGQKAMDTVYKKQTNVLNAVCSRIKNERVPTLRFGCTAMTVKVLGAAVEYAEKHSDNTVFSIATPAGWMAD